MLYILYLWNYSEILLFNYNIRYSVKYKKEKLEYQLESTNYEALIFQTQLFLSRVYKYMHKQIINLSLNYYN